jgi:hypothetical protein
MSFTRALTLTSLLASGLALGTARADAGGAAEQTETQSAHAAGSDDLDTNGGLTISEAAAKPGPPAQASSEVARLEAEIVARGFSAPRLLALGSAQREVGALGPAIASFERGLLVAPRHERLAHALAEARAEAGLGLRAEPPLERLAHRLSMREWTALALAGALASALLLGAAAVVSSRRRTFAALFGATLVLVAASVGGLRLVERDLQRAIVLERGAELKQSPFPAARGVRALAAGESVTLTSERHEAYVHVIHASGAHGWIRRNSLAAIAAPAPVQG